MAELVEAPPQRLLKLLAQSLKYQAQQGIISPSVRLDLFADRVFEYKEEEESIVRAVEKIVKYPQESRVSAMQFSNGGEHLALGFEDGLIELYDPNQYKIDTKLEYQGSNFLFHGSAVTALAFQETDEMLASGDKTGQLKIWNLRNGKCLRKINTGSHPVSALTFGPDPSHVICAYEAIDVYGLKSTTVLRSFKGHASYVNSVRVLEERNQLFSCSRDGSIKVWNYLTQEEMKSYSPSTQSVVQPEINKLVFFDSCQRVLICHQRQLPGAHAARAEVLRLAAGGQQGRGVHQLGRVGAQGAVRVLLPPDLRQEAQDGRPQPAEQAGGVLLPDRRRG